MPFVLDCSMTMAWIFPDEANQWTDGLRESLLADSAVVPGLWPIEVANVLLIATRRGRIRESEWPALLDCLTALPIEVDPQTSTKAFFETLSLAGAHELSVYDAVYLELALRRSLPLATLDRRLVSACRSAGVGVLAAT